MSEVFGFGGGGSPDIISDQASHISENEDKEFWAFVEGSLGSSTSVPAGTQKTFVCQISKYSSGPATETSKFNIDWLVVRYHYNYTHDIRALLYPEKTVECPISDGGKIALTLTTSGIYWIVRVDITAGASGLYCYSKLSAAIGSVRDA